MKGFAENTMPQRQYENIKIRYYFETPAEKKEALDAIVQDCIDYKDIVNARMAMPAEAVAKVMTPEEVVKYLKLPEGTKLKKVFNKEIGEYLYFDMKTGTHYNHPPKD